MCLFKVSYRGRNGKKGNLRYGNVYNVEQQLWEDGKEVFMLEGMEGKYDTNDFFMLETKGLHYLNGQSVPKVGGCMRLVKRKNDIAEFMTGEVKEVERTGINGLYIVSTERCMYKVSTM